MTSLAITDLSRCTFSHRELHETSGLFKASLSPKGGHMSGYAVWLELHIFE